MGLPFLRWVPGCTSTQWLAFTLTVGSFVRARNFDAAPDSVPKKPRPRHWAGFEFGRNRATDATGIILILCIGSALTPINFVLNLWAHRNSVIHSGDPWCQPGSAFGLFALRPGSHSASED